MQSWWSTLGYVNIIHSVNALPLTHTKACTFQSECEPEKERRIDKGINSSRLCFTALPFQELSAGTSCLKVNRVQGSVIFLYIQGLFCSFFVR